jgi:signal transduction histidine kinase/two-component SAPR family response regulator
MPPRGIHEDDAPDDQHRPRTRMSESAPDAKVNILLVDDRPDKLLAIEAVLEDLDQNIVRAYSGREALRHVLTEDFAVILLDVNMPGMDGFETATLIRQRKSSEHVPIIFITAFGDEMLASRGYSLGAVDYILTPVVPEVLRSKVSVFVDLFRKTEQVRRQADSLRRRAAQMQRLAAASVAINSALSIDRMLQTVTDTAREVIGSHQAITLFVDPRPGGPRQRNAVATASYSDRYDEWRAQPLQLEPIADTAVFRSYTATRLTEAELHDHPDWEIVRRLRIPPIRGGMLAAPLTGRDGTRLGVIYLCDRVDSGPFSADDESIAVQLAQMVSIAVENTLYAEEREANRIKDEFLSTLSHELRTPLNAILGWTQLLQMEKPDGEIAHGLEVIERNARAQTKLIEDLLDVSRISTGKLRLHTRLIPVSSFIQSALDAVKPTADARGVLLVAELPPPSLRLAADPDRLQQVVWNLLSNAVKFTPARGRVTVHACQVDADVQISVTDTGQGIDPAFLPHVFDRFRQADSTSTRSHGGLGIGLTIVRHIVELHGGTARADSRGEGHGSTFTVTLPITAAVDEPPANGDGQRHPAAAATPAQRATDPENADRSPADRIGDPDDHVPGSPTAATPLGRLAGVRVLIVDDAADALDVLAVILRRAHADVTTAPNARDARRILSDQRPDLLISDIAMPDEDGFALIRAVRALPRDHGGATPAIALTAYAREEDRAKALAAGFHAHLAKPIEPEDLVSLVARLAGQPSPTLTPTAAP